MDFRKGGEGHVLEFQTSDGLRKITLLVKYSRLGDFVFERPRESLWEELEIKYLGHTGETEGVVRSYTTVQIRIAEGTGPDVVSLRGLRRGLRDKNMRLRIIR